MEVIIVKANMQEVPEEGYLGHVVFRIANHVEPYEITLQSKTGRDWNYSLIFAENSGPEEQISAVEEQLEQNDDFFDALLEAAEAALEA